MRGAKECSRNVDNAQTTRLHTTELIGLGSNQDFNCHSSKLSHQIIRNDVTKFYARKLNNWRCWYCWQCLHLLVVKTAVHGYPVCGSWQDFPWQPCSGSLLPHRAWYNHTAFITRIWRTCYYFTRHKGKISEEVTRHWAHKKKFREFLLLGMAGSLNRSWHDSATTEKMYQT